MAMNNIVTAAKWLMDGARSATGPQQVLEDLCDRLVSAGVPLCRAAVFVRTLHPDVMGRLFLWRLGAEVTASEVPFDFFASEEFRRSPVVLVYATGGAVRRRLADKHCPADFPLLSQLRAEGATDYFAVPLVFTDGSVHAATWATRQNGGFSDAQIAEIESVVAPLARIAEIYALRRTAANLLSTYVGSHAGARILAGQIRRGHTEGVNAIIWLSDMRGFTSLSDHLPSQSLIDLLNRYFDCQVPVILGHGGEVLKFMGDGLLAIFPIAEKSIDVSDKCMDVLAASRQVRSNVANIDAPIGTNVAAALGFGLALHVGTVQYGNIGGGNRLDFTCIGPAVNLAARIEKLSGKLRRTVLASCEFARHCRSGLIPIGDFTLAGFSSAQRVFGLEDEAAPL